MRLVAHVDAPAQLRVTLSVEDDAGSIVLHPDEQARPQREQWQRVQDAVRARLQAYERTLDVDSAIAFSPDSGQFAFLRGVPTEGTAFVMLASADGSNVRPLAQLQRPSQFTLNGLTWSADGRTILAGARSLEGGPHELIVAVDVATGEPRPMEGRWNSVLDLEWVEGTSSFVAAAAETGISTAQLWQITYPEGQRRRITNDLTSYRGVSVSADGTLLSTVQTTRQARIWIVSADGGEATEVATGPGRTIGAAARLLEINLPPDAEKGFNHLGVSMDLAFPLGVLELTCVVIYLVPRTAVLGAMLLTAYLGGAVATHARVESPLLTHTLFPVYVAVLLWVGLALRETRLRELLPLRA